MALVVADRVKETTTTTGTGAITLAGAETNFVTFSSVLSNADTTYYAIVDNTNSAFEVGLGTYASSGNTITRTTIISSSNSDNVVNLQAGSKDVFITLPSNKFPLLDASGNVDINGGTIDGTTIGGSSAAAGTFTTFTSNGIDDNASSTSVTVSSGGKVTIDPAGSTQGTHELSVREADSPRISIDDINGSDTDVNASLLLRAGVTNKGVVGYSGSDDLRLENKTAAGSTILATNDIDRLTVDSSGNVGIGNTAPYDVRVHITGDQNDEDPTLGSPTGALVVSNTDTAYGLQMGVSSDGNGWIQQGRVDGTATAYNLNLQPVGGNVGIGVQAPTSKLEVGMTNGDVITLKDTNLTASSSNIGNVRVAWDDSAGTRVAYVGTVNSDEFWINNQYSEVVLTYAGSRMFETRDYGAKLYGKLNINDSEYDNHLELNRSSEQWRFSPSTDGSLDIRRISGTSTAYLDVQSLMRVAPTDGSVTIGPQNTSFCHFSTDRAKHYFNKPVYMDGGAVDYDTDDHFLLPNADNSESPNLSTARSGGAINYIYNRGSDVTLTRGDFAHHIIQQWSGTATFTITSSTFLRGDIIEFINVRGTVTITVVGTRIYLPTGSYDTTLTLSQKGKFRLLKYSTSAGYWMVG